MALPSRPPERVRIPHYGLEEDQLLQEQRPIDVFTDGSETSLTTVDLGDLFINDKAVLHEVELLSRRDFPLKIFLSWEQGSGTETVMASMEFQLENANLSASREASDTPTPPYFNELLNQACTVNDFVLPVGRRQSLVLVLYPCLQDPSAAATSFSKISGFVHFSARRATAAELEAEGLPPDGAVEEGHLDENEGNASDRPAALAVAFESQGKGKGGIGKDDGTRRERPPREAKEIPAEKTLLEVKGKVCRSILSADIRELQFLEACPGASYVKEFSVWNKSEIPLSFRLVPSVWLSTDDGVLACSDYDTGAPLPTSSPGRTIGAYAHLRVRVTFRPREVGERDYRIFVENLNNFADTLAVDILTSVVCETHGEGLRIQTEGGDLLEGGSVLQFDNCYTGIPMSRRLKIKNTTVKSMDISLGSDRPREVMFELETDASASHRRARRRLSSLGNSEDSRTTGVGPSRDDGASNAGAGGGSDSRSPTHAGSGERGSSQGKVGQADDESEIQKAVARVADGPEDLPDCYTEWDEGEGQFELIPSTEWGPDRAKLSTRSRISSSRRNRRQGFGGSRCGESDRGGQGSGGESGAGSGTGSGSSSRKLRGCSRTLGESGSASSDSGDAGSIGVCSGDGGAKIDSVFGRGSGHPKRPKGGRPDVAQGQGGGGRGDLCDYGAGGVGIPLSRTSPTDRTSGGRRGAPNGRGMSCGGRRGGDRGPRSEGSLDCAEEWQGPRGVFEYDTDEETDESDELEVSRRKRTVRYLHRQRFYSRSGSGGYRGLCAFHGGVHSPGGTSGAFTMGGEGGTVGGSKIRVGGVGSDVRGSVGAWRAFGLQAREPTCRVCTEVARRSRRIGTMKGRTSDEQPKAATGQRASNYIEEMSLGPGVERILRVHFCAASLALEAVAAAGGTIDGDDDRETASTTTARASRAKKSTAPLSSKERGGERRSLSALRGTTLSKQAFKLFFRCQEPRDQWNDGFLDERADGEGYTNLPTFFRRKSSVGVDVRQFSKNIAGRAMVCTSVLTVAPREIAFGNCNIGEYKCHTLEIGNMSNLPAVAIANVFSKVVTCKPVKLEIPAHGKAEMKVEYVPRKINSNYRKKVTVVNCLNPHGNVDVEITGSNIDTHHVLYHSHFYKVVVNNRMRQQQVYFNHVVTGCQTLRTFEIHNVYQRSLLFELGTDTPEVQIFEMVGPRVKRASRSLTPAGTGRRHVGDPGAGATWTASNIPGADGSEASSSFSGRELFLKALNWEEPGEIRHERGLSGRDGSSLHLRCRDFLKTLGGLPAASHMYNAPRRSQAVRKGCHLHGPIRGMDIEMPPGKNPMYGTPSVYAGTTAGERRQLRSDVGLSRSDAVYNLSKSTEDAPNPIRGGGATPKGGGFDIATHAHAGTASASEGGEGSGGGGVGDEPAWTLEELVESFETDHLGSARDGDGGDDLDGVKVRPRAGSKKAAASGGGAGQAEETKPRTERDMREWQVHVMRKRVSQLKRAVKEARLKPLAHRFFQVHPGKQTRIAVVLNLASTGSAEELERERTVERQIQMRLLNVNSSHLPPSLRRETPAASPDGGVQAGVGGISAGGRWRSAFAGPRPEPIRIRNLLVRGNACRSEMTVAQKNINFGKVAVGEYATRTVELTNRSPVPLLYNIIKSRSINSAFLKIPQGGKGVIPAHSSKDIQFAFCPNLAGTFVESLTVTNVLDESNTQVIKIKAKVYKPESFALVDPPEVMRLEPCLVGEPLAARPRGEARVLLRNTTPRRRVFVIEGEARRVNAVLDAFQGASLTNDHESCVVEVVESSPSSGIDAYSAAKSAAVKRDSIDSSHAIVFAAAASAAAASLSEAMSPSEGGSETSAVGTEGESAKGGSSSSPRPDMASSRLRLSSAGSDVTITTDLSRPIQGSGSSVPIKFSEVTSCSATFRFKLDAVSTPGIPEVERQRMEEKLEQNLFKLRIAERKGREAKAAKIHKKIDRLRKQLAGEPLGSDDGEETGVSESESDSDVELQLRERTGSGWAAGNGVFKREGVGRLELSVDGDSEISVGICLSFTPGAFFQGWEGGHLFRGVIRLYEFRNEDVVKELPCLAQVYSSAVAYQAVLQPAASPSVEDEAEVHEVLSPLPPLSDGGGKGRKTNSKTMLLPPRSPTELPSSNTSPTLSVSTSFSGGSMPASSAPANPAGTFTSGGNVGGASFVAGGDGIFPLEGSGDDRGGVGSPVGARGVIDAAPASLRSGGLPELLRQVGIQTMRVFGAGPCRDSELCGRNIEPSEDADADACVSVPRGNMDTGGGDRAESFLVPVPQRPDHSTTSSLTASLVESPVGFMCTPKRRVDRTLSPSLVLPQRRASYPALGHPWNFVDLRENGTRSSSPLPSAVSGKIDDLYDPDGEGATAIWRTSSPPTFQPFRELKATTSSKEMPSEPPLFVTVAHFCMFGAAEEGVMSPTLASGDVDDGHAGNLLSVGGGGAVTPSVLPSLFPQGSAAGCTLSEGVKMVLSSGEHEGGTALGGCPSPGMFSLHSVVSEDVIVKVSWDDDSARRLGVLPVPCPAFLFRAEPPPSGSQPASASTSVLAAVLRTGTTLDISVKLDGPVSVPVGRWCVGAVMVVVKGQPQTYGESTDGGNGANGSGNGNSQKLLVPLVLEVLPESCLGVSRKVDLGTVALDSKTPSSFEVQNLSVASAPLRFVVMVVGKPATNSLLLTSQQTGTLPPGGSVHVSFDFHASSVGRWTHDLAVRNLSNKHDQAKVTVSATVKPRIYLHFPDLDPKAKGKPEKLQLGYCYMPGGPADPGARKNLPTPPASGGDVDHESEIVRPLRVRNVSDRKLYLTCTPNLRKQCFVFAEIPSGSSYATHRPESEIIADTTDLASPAAIVPRPAVTDFPLLPQSEMTLYIGLRPVLPPEAYTVGDCRELIGGVRIQGHSRPLSEVLPADAEKAKGKSAPEISETLEATGPEMGLVGPPEGAGRPSGNLKGGEEAAGTRLVADRLFELTIKFVGTVGVSILRFPVKESPISLLNLGCGAWAVDIDGPSKAAVSTAVRLGGTSGSQRRIVSGFLEFENVTKALPLAYRLETGGGQGDVVGDYACDSNETGILARLNALPEGYAELVVLAEAEGTLPPASRRSVRFLVLLHAFQGLFHRQISVRNMSSSERGNIKDAPTSSTVLNYHVRLFADDGCVQLEIPSLPETPATAAPLEIRPRLSSESPAGLVDFATSNDLEETPQDEQVLTDEYGTTLPSLETLTMPFAIPVAPCFRASSAKLSRFRILHPVAVEDNLSAKDAHDETDEIHSIEENYGTPLLMRGTSAPGGYENSPTTLPAREGLRVCGSDINLLREDEDACGISFRITNVTNRTVLLAPYSNIPLFVKAIATSHECVDDASAGLFDFENDGDDFHRSVESFEGGTGDKHLARLAIQAEEKEPGRQDLLAICGPAVTLAARATAVVRLSVRTGALTQPLPTSALESGRAVPFDGIIAFGKVCEASLRHERKILHRSGKWGSGEGTPDRVEYDSPPSGIASVERLRLVKLVRALGTYCRPRLELSGPAVIDLGNVGHTASKRGRRRFEVRLRSLCDTPVLVGMLGISPELEVVRDRDNVMGQQTQEKGERMIVMRRKVAHLARNNGAGSRCNSAGEIFTRMNDSHAGIGAPKVWGRKLGDGRCPSMLLIPPRSEATLMFQLRLSRRRQSWAGAQTFGIRLANLTDPSAEEISVSVLAQVVTQLVSFIDLDEVPPSPILRRLISPGTPTFPGLSIRRRPRSSSIETSGSFSAASGGGSVRLAPLTIPPPRDAAGRSSGSFQIKNVSDETVLVTLRATPAPEVAGVLSLGASLQQQDSSTGVYAWAGAEGRPSPSVVLLRGDVLDVHAECLAQRGKFLTAELLQPPTSAAETAALSQSDMRAGGLLVDQPLRLLGTILVEIALEDRGDEPDGLDDEGMEHTEGVLIESVALIGSLIPGPTFELSHTSVTVALRTSDCGGSSGGWPCNVTHPFESDGPASFFVKGSSPSQGPVRIRLEGGGKLHLARGVRMPGSEDKVGGWRLPERVVNAVTAVAEPSRGTVFATSKREIAVRLAAAETMDHVPNGTKAAIDERGERRVSSDATGLRPPIFGTGYVAGGHDSCNLFVSITDVDHPGYPPRIVTVNVEIAALNVMEDSSQADVLGLGTLSMMGTMSGAPLNVFSLSGRDSGGTHPLPGGDVVDGRDSRLITVGSQLTRGAPSPSTEMSLEIASSVNKLSSDTSHEKTFGAVASGESLSRVTSARAVNPAASIAVATAAAIAAGPLFLVASASEAAAAAPLPRLDVRGCTPVSPRASRFEINLGQQLVCGSSLEWSMSLIGPAARRVRRGSNSSSLLSVGDNRRIFLGSNSGEGGGWAGSGDSGFRRPDRPRLQFRLYTLQKSDAEWLTLGQRDGQLTEGGKQDITLYFNRSRVGVFSTFLIVENLTNPVDLKIVRVEMEVVDGGLKDMVSQLFEVLVSPPAPKGSRGLPPGLRAGGGTAGVGTCTTRNGPSRGIGSGYGRTGAGAKTVDGLSDRALTASVHGAGVNRVASEKELGKGFTNCSRNMGSGTIGGVEGAKESLVLDFGDVYEGELYRRRSFVIINHSGMPLEFQLSSSLPSSELNFSLSAVTLKQFKSVHVEANTRLQVYVHYRPVAKTQPAEARTAFDQGLMTSDSCQDAVLVRERLSITCRLVKDFQQEIQLLARRHPPQLRLLVEGNLSASGETRYSDSVGILYVVREKSSNDAAGGGLEVEGKRSRLVIIRNLRPGRRVVVAVVNVSMYFSVSPVMTGISLEDGSIYPAVGGASSAGSRGWAQGFGAAGVTKGIDLFEIAAGGSLTLSVEARLDKLRSEEGLALLANELQLEEHFMVYNRRRPTEQCRITLKLTSGALRMFFLSPGSKNAHPFRTLEDKIATFLQAYQAMWREFLELNPAIKTMLNEKEGELVAAKEKFTAHQESGLSMFQQALDRLDAAVLAAEESISNAGDFEVPVGPGGNGVPGKVPAAVGSGSATLVAALAQQSSRLIFEMFYITDELLHYALKHEGFVGSFALRLANLLYSVVFRHTVFKAFATPPEGNRDGERAPVFLRRWGAHLNYFLGYFSYPKPVILPLVELRSSLAPCFVTLLAGEGGRTRDDVPPPDGPAPPMPSTS